MSFGCGSRTLLLYDPVAPHGVIFVGEFATTCPADQCEMVYDGDHTREPPLWRRIAQFFQHLLSLFCCGAFMDERDEAEGPDDAVQDPCSRPLQEVAEHSALLSNRRQESAGSLRKPCCAPSTTQMSPQEHLFSMMKKPSFSTGNQHGPSMDEETCMICLEDFNESNPKMYYECGHGELFTTLCLHHQRTVRWSSKQFCVSRLSSRLHAGVGRTGQVAVSYLCHHNHCT